MTLGKVQSSLQACFVFLRYHHRFLTLVPVLVTLFFLGYADSAFYRVYRPEQYLSLHTILEFLSIIVSFATASVIFLTRRHISHLDQMILALTFLIAGSIDLFHTLSYKGMPVFLTPSSAPKATTFWMIGRLVASSGFLAASFAFYRDYRFNFRLIWGVLISLFFIAFVLVLVTYYPHYLPAMYVEGQGLTFLKKVLEYVVVFLLGLAASFYLAGLGRPGQSQARIEEGKTLAIAHVISIFSELSFTLYLNVYDLYNLLGHLYKVISYYLFYDALFAAAVLRPYNELMATKQELSLAHADLERIVEERTLELRKTNVQLREASIRDPLTGAYNRRFLDEKLHDFIALDSSKMVLFSLLIMDIDRFKEINDLKGHVVGDQYLRNLVQVVKKTVRAYDLVGRYGGDEFIVVLPGVGSEQASLTADRIRKALREEAYPPIEISLGLASYPGDGQDVETLIKLADSDLYVEKEAKRQQVLSSL
ncbi:MAG: GGDEF domain-containing protein [Firmicutes bacterium]|nr:GGDEF domain-containing protein [Bacillota bacterium]MCL5039803.1 GGDEF domain-containing protein [Bacillota bacterium]